MERGRQEPGMQHFRKGVESKTRVNVFDLILKISHFDLAVAMRGPVVERIDGGRQELGSTSEKGVFKTGNKLGIFLI